MHLCVSCSICCDGTLFDRLTIKPNEEKMFCPEAQFFDRKEGRRMRLGCTALGEDGACALYENRPDNCRSFKCDLLKNFEADVVSEAHAKAIADEAKALRQRAIDLALSAIPTKPMPEIIDVNSARSALNELRSSNTPPEAFALKEADLHYDIFVRFIRAHIRRKFRRSWKAG